MASIKCDIVIVGAGPGGYAAAFYAADHGRKVILVEREERLGGVCLNRGCIPSKALLHASKFVSEAKESATRGISFQPPQIDLDKLRTWKNSIIAKLAQGISGLAEKRGVEVLNGRGYFENSATLRVETSEGQKFIEYQQAIIAVGSKSAMPKSFDLGNPRVMTSREALDIPDIPGTLLVVGGGYIGMELGTVYATLGSQVTVVETLDRILAGADPDLVKPVAKHAEKMFKEIRLKTKVAKMATSGKQIKVTFDLGEGNLKDELYDRVLVSVGRIPNCDDLGLENTKIQRDDKGFIKVNANQQTDDPKIYAIGDVAGGVLLAHKATREGRTAVEVITGESAAVESVIPAVVFTDPEVAWAGLTEAEAKERDIKIQVAKFPWSASGRALSFDRTDGLTKLIIDPETERILGVGVVGHGAGELIAEGVLAIEMGATAEDLALSVHPHPTLSETMMEAAEVFYGHATHTFSRKKETKPAQ